MDTRVIADRVNAQTFYTLDLFGGKLFINTNGACFYTSPAIPKSMVASMWGPTAEARCTAIL